MCYHVDTYLTAAQIKKRFAIDKSSPQTALFEPVHHVSGFSFPKLPVIVAEGESHVLDLYYWGLIPHWAKDEAFAKTIRTRTLNARAETITEKPSFRSAAKSNHCLIPATGFYEWHTTSDNKKIPHYIYLADHEPFAFAGIYDEWLNQTTGELIRSFSIVTTAANPMMANIHNTKKRMPVILPREHENDWLDASVGLNEQLALLQPFDEAQMASHTISKLITQRGANTNVAAVKAPAEPGFEPGEQASLF